MMSNSSHASSGTTSPRGALTRYTKSLVPILIALHKSGTILCNRLQKSEVVMSGPRISYVEPQDIKDPEIIEELKRCANVGTPRPESQSIRAHVPKVFWAFANTWNDAFLNGVLDHNIKELCRVYVSRSVKCEYCGNQRSVKSANAGVIEQDYLELIKFEQSPRYDERQKAALAYTEAITWDLETDDALWERLNKHYTEPEIVELGFFVGITMGQQRWLRTLNIEHHAVLSKGAASLAPGFETSEDMAKTKADSDYWAKSKQPGMPGAKI